MKTYDFWRNAFNLTWVSSYDLVIGSIWLLLPAFSIVGKSKEEKDALKPFQDAFVNLVIKHKNLLPEGYYFFGKWEERGAINNLEYLASHNPFVASALTYIPDEEVFELTSKDVDAKGEMSKTWFIRLSNVLIFDGQDRRGSTVRFVVEKYPLGQKLKAVKFYDKNGREVTDIYGQNEIAGDLLHILGYYFEAIHALIHIFHYLMASAVNFAADSYPNLVTWARPYMSNLFVKYEEVELLLLGPTGIIVTQLYSSNGVALRGIQKEILELWGSFATAQNFLDHFLFRDGLHEALRKSDLLPQFFAQVDLADPFAKDLYESFKEVDVVGQSKFEPGSKGDKTEKADKQLRLFLSDCGSGVSRVRDLKTWTSLMSVTGILHGSTIGLTRLLLTDELFRRSAKGENYGFADASYLVVGSSTITGMMEDRHVYSATLQSETIGQTIRSVKTLNPLTRDVLVQYDAKSTALKEQWYNKLLACKDLFVEFGWILTDHCPDGIDGKQLTITTYI